MQNDSGPYREREILGMSKKDYRGKWYKAPDVNRMCLFKSSEFSLPFFGIYLQGENLVVAMTPFGNGKVDFDTIEYWYYLPNE